MRDPFFFRRDLRNQKGIVFIAILFILIALAALGIAYVKFSGTSQESALKGLESQNAFFAAQSGAEWAAQQAKDNGYQPPYSQLTTPPQHALNSAEFLLAYDQPSDTLTSTGKKGKAERALTFAPFSQVVASGGTPNTQCAVANGPTGINWLFSQYVAVGGKSVTDVAGTIATGITPQTVTLPAFPQATYNNLKVTSATTLTSSAPNADKPELYFKDVTVSSGKTLTFAGPTGAGHYLTLYLQGDLTVESKAAIAITGNVRIVAQKDVKFADLSSVNVPSEGRLLLMAGGDVSIKKDAAINKDGNSYNMLVLAKKDIKLETGSTYRGGAFANADISVQRNATLAGAMVATKDVKASGAEIQHNPEAGKSVIDSIPAC